MQLTVDGNCIFIATQQDLEIMQYPSEDSEEGRS